MQYWSAPSPTSEHEARNRGNMEYKYLLELNCNTWIELNVDTRTAKLFSKAVFFPAFSCFENNLFSYVSGCGIKTTCKWI